MAEPNLDRRPEFGPRASDPLKKGAERRAPPGMGRRPKIAGTMPKKPRRPSGRFAINASILPVRSRAAPTKGVSETARAKNQIPGATRTSVKARAASSRGKVKTPRTRAPPNIAIPNFQRARMKREMTKPAQVRVSISSGLYRQSVENQTSR